MHSVNCNAQTSSTRYLVVLTDDHAVPIAQEIAGVLAFDRLNQLRDIDNEEQEQRA